MKEKITVFSLISMLLIIPSVIGADFSGFKYPQDTFTLNGDNFSIQLSKDWKSVYFRYNSETLIISNNSCKETSQNFYYICYRGAVVDFTAVNEIGRIDERTGEIVPGLNISIKYRKPEITLSRVFSKTNPIVMESVDVNVVIENTGKNPADISYFEIIPDGLEVTTSSNVIYEGGRILYVGVSNPGSRSILSYKIKPLRKLSENITGNLTYSYETIKGTINLAKTSINTTDTITPAITSAERINIESRGVINLVLKNEETENNAKITLTISLPSELKVISVNPREYKEIGEQKYQYDYDFKEQEYKEFEIDFETTKTGVYKIPINITYIVYGQKYSIEKNVSINVNSTKITPLLTINKEIVMANQRLNVKGTIRNDDSTASYYNIKAYIKSEILNDNFAVDKISQNEEIMLFDKEIISPTVNKSTNFILNFSGEYETINKEKFPFFASKTITVRPPSDLIVIYHEFDKWINESDKAGIKVYVENKWDSDITLTIDETIPESFKVIEGQTKNVIVIGPKRKSLIYTYTIQILDTGKKEDLTTNLRFNETGKEFTLTQTVGVNISAKTSLSKEIITKVIDNEANNRTANETSTQSKPDNKNESSQKESNIPVNPAAKPVKVSIWKRFFLWIDSLF